MIDDWPNKLINKTWLKDIFGVNNNLPSLFLFPMETIQILHHNYQYKTDIELPLDLKNAPHRTLCIKKRRPQKAKFFDASKSKSGYQSLQNRMGTLFDMLMFDNYENSLNDMAIWINMKKDLGMVLSHVETQVTTRGETQAATNGVFQATMLGALPIIEILKNRRRWIFNYLCLIQCSL